MPAINPCFAKAGTVFYVNDPMKRNSVTFTSEAPLEDIVGTTNEIKGYVVFDPENPKDGVKGEFVVPVAALDTGIPLRDEHLRSPMWLDAKSYPHIKLVVKDAASRVRNVKSTEDFETYEATLDTEVTLHGVSRTMDIPARMVYMPESEKTKQKMPGDLLAGRSTFEVPLDLFGITGPAGQDLIGTRVGETVEIEVSFTGTTSKQAGNPCNPCGKNPCNPCGKNPCNPCGKNPCNPCGKNPCNPCGKNPCNPCGK